MLFLFHGHLVCVRAGLGWECKQGAAEPSQGCVCFWMLLWHHLLCPQAYNGHCEALKTLAETLVNLDVRDHKGRTALYLATERGSTECVEVLTSHGASALVKERKRKWTPLHAAGNEAGGCEGARDARLPISQLLLREGERAVAQGNACGQDGIGAVQHLQKLRAPLPSSS